MAVALDTALGTHASSASTTNILPTGAAVASGAQIIVVLGWFQNGATTAAVSGGGLTWVEDAVLRATNIHISIQRAFAPAGLASSTNLTATISATADSLIGATSFTGIDTTGTVVTSGTNNGSVAGWTAACSSTSGNAIIGGAFMDGAATTNTETAPSVESFDFNSAGQTESLVGEYKLSVAGGDSIAGTFGAAATWISAVVCYKAAAAAAVVAGSPRSFAAIPVQAQGRNL